MQAGLISTASILPLTAVVEQAASTLVVCFCEETVDHEANGSVFRRLVLPPHLHACLNDSLHITAHYQSHQQHLARERAQQAAVEAEELAAASTAPARVSVAQFDTQPQQAPSALFQAETLQAGPRQSVAFGAVQELRRSTIRSSAPIFPASAMRTDERRNKDDDVVPIVE